MSRPLPQPSGARWQPLRAGLVDVFYYDQEEFWFRDGRLLLRGNNGTGKSKVLALMLPFLLDGELSSHRVEPDADPKKRMEWNLLLGGEHPHPERLGYTWLEFGRRDPDGAVRYCTLGCGLKAVSGRGIASHWFFVTGQRVGDQLALADAASIPLTRERLEEALGSEGAVHRTARAYRRAVDETLFGLGEARYAALLDLLISIRAPQLSKRPSERALSDALTEALPPLDQALIADVAEAFRSLEEDRAALAAMVEARDAASAYLDTYRGYAQIACRRRAAGPRQAQTVYDRVSRDRSEAQEAHEQARHALEAEALALSALREEQIRLQARDRALRESPEARSAQELESAEREARTAAKHAADAAAQHDSTIARVHLLRAREAAADERVVEAAAALNAARRACGQAAGAALIEHEYATRVDGAIDAEALGELQRRAAAIVERQAQAVTHVRALLELVDARAADVDRARERLDELIAEQDALAARHAEAVAQLAAASSGLVRDAHAHLDAARMLALDDRAGVIAALELWVETLDGPNPLRAAVDAAGRAATARLADAQAALRVRRDEAEAAAAELRAAVERLEAGEDDLPPPAHTRDADARAERPGAPLWPLVDFHDGLSAEDRAGLEAALEAAGLLDAWVCPDGAVLDPETHDTIIDPAGAGLPDCQHLGAALAVAIDPQDAQASAVSESVVRRVLASIGLGESAAPVWVATTGAFRNGVLVGRWRKPAASYIGRGAREAARRVRLADLRGRLDELGQRIAEIAGESERVARERTDLDTELATTPTDELLRTAHAALLACDDEQRRLQERGLELRARAAAANEALEQSEQAARDGAEELRLPADTRRLDAVAQALAELRAKLAALWPAAGEHERATQEAQHAVEERAGGEHDAAAQAARGQTLKGEAEGFAERHRVLAGTVGAAVAELQAQLGTVGAALRDNGRAREAAERRQADAQRAEGIQAGRLERLADELEQATARRREDVDALHRFAATGLIAVALPEVDVPADDEWTVTAALRVARQIEHDLEKVADDEPAWTRAQRRATDEASELGDALRRHGNNATAQLREEGITVEVVFRGRTATVPALACALAEEVADRERLLDEREREILENHLVNEVASTLQELIGAAEAQVVAMNDELANRPTSTGMRLRLQWRTAEDGPDGLAVARERLLRQTADAWSEDDRGAVGAFLQAQIQDVRARDASGTWLEHLAEALDYRSWHRFAIQRLQGGQWRSASGPASGGERVLAASVPLFAAASSHYASATNPHAPRLVMLDEAFAGVDDDSRAKCLGLLAAFDLDVVMTSEREWGCYPEVPGLAIAQLSRMDGIAAVLVTHWEWDGTTRAAVERPQPPTAVAEIPLRGVAPDSPDTPGELWTTPPTRD